MKTSMLLFLSFLIALKSISQPDSINQRIFLIGDAGEMPGTTHPVIAWLKEHVDWNDDKNTVLYLGDNIYPLGMPMQGEPSYPDAKRILDDQISLVKGKKARAIFVPGNHDWKNGKLGGWQQVTNQVDYINLLNQKNIQALPLNGCPGPIPVELSDKVVVAIIDSQWFLFLHDKPGPGSNCSSKTVDEFETELREIANSHPNQLLIVAMHHPVYSYGVHGGNYSLKEHIFPLTAAFPKLYIPLPVIGSLYPLARGVFGSVQDLPHPLYQIMSGAILEAIKAHPDHIVVSGHDHGLQFIQRDSVPYVISGAGSVLTRVRKGSYLKFSDVEVGFSMIEVWKSGKTDIKYYNLHSQDIDHPTYSTELKKIVPTPAQNSIDTTKIILDSVAIVAANPKLRISAFQQFLMGKNYRREWKQPVRVSVLDLNKEGLKPTKQMGGRQYKSLIVTDTTGKEWSIRNMVRYPENVVPSELRLEIDRQKVPDGQSAYYPYGALSMGVLSGAAGVPYLRNRLVYLPDDPRLDRFRTNFRNTLALMEEQIPVGEKKYFSLARISSRP